MKTATAVNIVERYNDPEKKDYNHVCTIRFFGIKQDDGSYEDLTDDQLKSICKMMKVEVMGGSYPVFLNQPFEKKQDSNRNEFPDLG